MAEPIRNVGTPSAGLKELSDLVAVNGVARDTTTLVTINDDAIVEQWRNNGVPVHRLKGDGRLWFRILPGAPVTPVSGDVWLEEVSGTTRVRYRTAGGATLTLATTDPSSLQITASAALLQGHAVRSTGPGLAYAQATVGAGNPWRVVGILAADVALSAPGSLLVTGDHLTLPDWSLLTGSATLSVGEPYWLSVTPGRYTLTPPAAVAARVGKAVTATTLLIDTGLVRIG